MGKTGFVKLYTSEHYCLPLNNPEILLEICNFAKSTNAPDLIMKVHESS